MADDEECGEIRCVAHSFLQIRWPFLYPADFTRTALCCNSTLWDAVMESFPIASMQGAVSSRTTAGSSTLGNIMKLFLEASFNCSDDH